MYLWAIGVSVPEARRDAVGVSVTTRLRPSPTLRRPRHRARRKAPPPRSSHRRVRDLQAAVDDGEALLQLFFRDAERRVGEEVVPVDERVHPLLAEERAEL